MRQAGLALFVVTFVVAACSSAEPWSSPSRDLAATASPAASIASSPAAVSASPAPTPTLTKKPAVPLAITSSAFAEGGPIPREFTCDGAGTSPPLVWSGIPAGTAALFLIVDDPDAGGFIHWVASDLNPTIAGLAAGASTAPNAPAQGTNSFGRIGYGGPCPPSGTHRYVFRLLAVDRPAAFRGGTATAGSVLAAAAGHTLAEVTLTGTYRRH